MSDDESKVKVAGRAPAGKWIQSWFLTLNLKNPTHQIDRKLFITKFLLLVLITNGDVVKAGGMRIVQHKAPNSERAAKGEPVDIIGLSQNNPIDSVQLSTSPSQKTMTIESSQAAHAHKPAASVPNKPMNNIQQPRK